MTMMSVLSNVLGKLIFNTIWFTGVWTKQCLVPKILSHTARYGWHACSIETQCHGEASVLNVTWEFPFSVIHHAAVKSQNNYNPNNVRWKREVHISTSQGRSKTKWHFLGSFQTGTCKTSELSFTEWHLGEFSYPITLTELKVHITGNTLCVKKGANFHQKVKKSSKISQNFTILPFPQTVISHSF